MLTEEPPYRPDAAGDDQTIHRPSSAPFGAPGQASAATSEPGPPVAVAAARSRWWERAGLLLPLAVAAVLNLGNLSINGYGNTYYSAAVRSMSRSWHNFFFAAFDQGGFISIDKPPVSLWIEALSVRLFGWSSWSILAPAALAGTASVALLWLIVRRWFGSPAASLAALVLATTPVAVAANRVNLPDPFLIAALLGAVWCLVRGIDSRGSAWRLAAWMIGAGALVGVAFNTKMLAALIPGPALAVALLAAPASSWRRRLGRTAAFGAACVAFSVPWMLIVDAWPASSRPYVGGSSDNTVWDLVVGYNGLGRVEGQSMGGPAGFTAGGFGQRGPSSGGQAPAFGPGGATANVPSSGPGVVPTGGPPANVSTQAGSPGPGRAGGPGGAGGVGGPGAFGGGAMTGAGGIMAGSPGPFRLLSDALGGQIGWLLPLAGAGAAAAAWEHRRRGRALTQLGLWAGWATLYGTVFSLAQGTFHAYYTAAMAPAIAALVGIGTVSFVRLARTERWWIVALGATGVVTALWQRTLLGRAAGFFPDAVWVMAALVTAGVAGLAVVAWRGVARPGRAALLPAAAATILLGLLAGPSAWAASETANRTLNMTLPQAGPRQGSAGSSFGSSAFHGDEGLAAFLVANRGGERWDLVTGSAQTAAGYIVQDGLSVMALGGFMGTDPSLTVDGFADLVEQGQVRFVLTGSGGAGRPMSGGGSTGSGQAASILAAASAACTSVASGATSGSAVTLPAAFAGQLYDCAGAGAALRSAAG